MYRNDDPSVANIKDKKKRLDKAELFLTTSKKVQVDVAHILASRKGNNMDDDNGFDMPELAEKKVYERDEDGEFDYTKH